MNPRVLSVSALQNYRICLEFDNSERRVFDVSPYLEKGIFRALKDPEMFNSVRVVDGTVQWQNEADFCPDTLWLESEAVLA